MSEHSTRDAYAPDDKEAKKRGGMAPAAFGCALNELLDSHQIAETGTELVGRQGNGGRQFREMLGILKILAFELNHVSAGAFVGFAVHVDAPVLHATGLGVEHFLERQRNHLAVHHADDGAVFLGSGDSRNFTAA